MQDKLMVVDGNSLLHRAFYALPPLSSSTGQPVGAVQGFLNMLLRLLQEEAPTQVAIAFDLKGPTFRHQRFEAYKAGRKPTPDELRSQFDVLKEILREMHVAVVQLEGYEADDILGTLSAKAQQRGEPCVLVSGDRDALQLVGETTRVVFTQKGISQTIDYTPKVLETTLGVDAEQFIDLKALMGDKSDNIPGIPGIGEKKALKLLQQFGTLDALLEHPEAVQSKSERQKVEQYADQARLSKWLATIDRQAPLSERLEDLRFDWKQTAPGVQALMRYDMKTLARRLERLCGGVSAVQAEKPPAAQELPPPQSIKDAAALEALLPALRAGFAMTVHPACTLFDGTNCYRVGQPATLLEQGFEIEDILATLAPLLSDPQVPKTVHDAKALLHRAAERGIAVQGVAFDTMIAAYLVDPAQGEAGVQALADKYLSQPVDTAAAVWALQGVLQQHLKQEGMLPLFRDVEMPLMRVLFDMEQLGFVVDVDALRAMGERMELDIRSLTQTIYALAGHEFNIQSPKQLGEVLFEELGLPASKKTKTGYSTSVQVLESLEQAHPIVAAIMQYRQVTKLKSTYVDGLLHAAKKPDNRVHTRFRQTLTATGRISSVEPNLQNIPVRTEAGRDIRKVFVAGQKGWMLVGADYSQIELRVLAHIADDAVLQDAFLKGQDIHARTAAEVLGIDLKDVTPQMRAGAKAVNFGIVYGISEFGLARNAHMTRAQAKDYIQRYLSRYQGIQAYMKRVVEQGKRDGYVSTLMGRRRYVRELNSANYNTRSAAERVALNAPIQGSAADIIKKAMVDVHAALLEEGLQARMVLQIHDEILVEAPADEVQSVANILRERMMGVMQLKVPLETDVKWGARWYDTK